MTQSLIPAAQYLRMSTDHQQYSLNNQADTISRYATERGFLVVKTYSDAAKSGLRLKNRAGLKQLLKDVVGGQLEFSTILVYDVSRWGRFQDMDEAAHYEYLCKSSGVPVHYCAELFSNDNSMSGSIMKALKRTMAGEYSRELSVKVRAGLFRLAKLGYKLGGRAAYGLRRQLLDARGRPKQILADGERKSIANEHVIVVPGPPEEIATVNRIFHEFADEHRSLSSIAARLNDDGIPFLKKAKWNASTVTRILSQPQYAGTQTWGRTTAFLSGPVKRVASENWATCPNAFQPIITHELFLRAQVALASLTCRLTDEQLLERLKPVLKAHGKLNFDIIQNSRLCPSGYTYYQRFGGLLNVYARLGYSTPELSAQATSRQRMMLIRNDLIKNFVEGFPDQIQEARVSKRFRAMLRYCRTGLLISVVIARHCPTGRGKSRWLVETPKSERKRMTVLALLGEQNTSIESLRVFSKMDFKRLSIHVRADSEWLRSGEPLEAISEFLEVVHRIRG